MAQSDQYRQNELVVSATVLTAISTCCVAIRLLLRGFIIRKAGWDDGLILGATILTIGYLTCIYVLKENHAGFPMDTLSVGNMLDIIKATLAIQVIYYAIIACVKISILCMYLRIAVTQIFRNLVFGTIALHAGFCLICITTTLAQCRPLHKMWDLTGTVEGSCINTTAFFYSTSAFNILTDIWILALPIKTLMGINRPAREKFALIAIFTVGAFAAITSIVRLHSIYTYTEAKDPFRDSLKVNIWSMVEVNVGIICASVPALKPLFTPERLKDLSRGSHSSRYRSDRHFPPTQDYGRVNTATKHEDKSRESEAWPMPAMPQRANLHNGNSSESTDLIFQKQSPLP